MLPLRICIDVDDLEKAIQFYSNALGLRLGRRFDQDWAEMIGASATLDLLGERAGTSPSPFVSGIRSYERHWTPVHLDFVVQNIEPAVEKAERAGAKLEKGIQEHVYGRLALMSDPFGHGFCLLEFKGKGYDEIKGPR